MKHFFILSGIFLFFLFAACGNNSYDLFGDDEDTEQTTAPLADAAVLQISLPETDSSGNSIYYYQQQEVTLYTDVEGIQVKYTLDGTDPKTSATAVTADLPVAINVPGSFDSNLVEVTLQAYTLADGRNDGEVISRTYQFPKIVYVSTKDDANGEIYLMNPDGSDSRRLTNNTYPDSFPSWSRDNRKIIYTSKPDGVNGIFEMDIDGSNVKRMYMSTSDSFNPSYSSDGNMILFLTMNSTDFDPAIMNSGSTTPSVINIDSMVNFTCDWHPDGKRFIYSSQNVGGYEISIYNIATLTNQVIISAAGINYKEPGFSADGNYFVFSSDTLAPGVGYEIYLRSTDGSNLPGATGPVIQMTSTSNTENSYPAFSPDGKKVVYESKNPTDGDYEILIMDVDFSLNGVMPNRAVLTLNNVDDRLPQFSN